MKTYAVFIRGINVGGKNKMPMAALRKCLEDEGFSNVSTYIASGNVILQSKLSATTIKNKIEKALPENFKLDAAVLKVLVLNRKQLETVIEHRPKGFGDKPAMYHSDAIFLIDMSVKEAMKAFDPREGVDTVSAGKGVIYSARLSKLRTKSRLSKIVASPSYKSMTIRNWNTTTKLLELVKKTEDTKKR